MMIEIHLDEPFLDLSCHLPLMYLAVAVQRYGSPRLSVPLAAAQFVVAATWIRLSQQMGVTPRLESKSAAERESIGEDAKKGAYSSDRLLPRRRDIFPAPEGGT